MDLSGRDGLGLSVAIYMGAMMSALAVIAVPVYLATAPQTYDNPPLKPLSPLLNGPIIGERVSTPMPLARLKREAIVDPAVVAELNAKAKQAEPARRLAVHHPARRDRGTSVAELPDQSNHSPFFLFRLFGG